MDTNSLILVVGGIVLIGSSIWGWRRRLARKRKPVSAPRVPSPSVKENELPPSVPDALKIATIERTRSVARAEISSVTVHWRENENCFVTLNLRSGEKLTGLIPSVEMDSMSENSTPQS